MSLRTILLLPAEGLSREATNSQNYAGFAVAILPRSGLMAAQMALWWWQGRQSNPPAQSRHHLHKALQLPGQLPQHHLLRAPWYVELHPRPSLGDFRESTRHRWP